VADTAFGPALAVGSGPYKNYTLYYITSDHIPSYGCTAGATSTPFGPFTCTGPSNDKSAEWPALTTTGQPVAGPGVNQALLGGVYRKGVGYQVTYAGHPLYLFDQSPGSVTGEGWFEPGLPPWYGIWWLMSPAGEPVPWAGTLTTTTIGGHKVLAESYQTGAGWINFPLYTFNGDAAYEVAACSASTACARLAPGADRGRARLDGRVHPPRSAGSACAVASPRSPGTASRCTCSATRRPCPCRTARLRPWATATESRRSAARSAWSPSPSHPDP